MDYRNISHKLTVLTEKQKSDLEMGNKIIQYMNDLVQNESNFDYDGLKFKPLKFGDEVVFINRILNYTIQEDFDGLVGFIKNDIEQFINSCNNSDSEIKNLEEYKTKISSFLNNYITLQNVPYQNKENLQEISLSLQS